MANEENLIPFNERTESEQREIQAKGGKASGAARRRKKAMRQAAATLLGSCLPDSESEFVERKIRPLLFAFGVSEEDATYQDVLLASIMLKAIKGDVRAAEFVRDTAGENPVLEIRKKELNLRKEELKLKREQRTGADGSQSGLADAMDAAWKERGCPDEP